jgi:hypothetical protein
MSVASKLLDFWFKMVDQPGMFSSPHQERKKKSSEIPCTGKTKLGYCEKRARVLRSLKTI